MQFLMGRDVRKFVAGLTLLALVAATLPASDALLTAAQVLACCNTSLCPLHHRPATTPQKDQSNCNGQGQPGQIPSTMRACDTTANQAVETALFVLVAPPAIQMAAPLQAAIISIPENFHSVILSPASPPPRANLS
jgi:hypothetical protein